MGAAFTSPKTPKLTAKPSMDIVIEDVTPHSMPATIRQLVSPKSLNKVLPMSQPPSS
jgi:hypothetical protein